MLSCRLSKSEPKLPHSFLGSWNGGNNLICGQLVPGSPRFWGPRGSKLGLQDTESKSFGLCVSFSDVFVQASLSQQHIRRPRLQQGRAPKKVGLAIVSHLFPSRCPSMRHPRVLQHPGTMSKHATAKGRPSDTPGTTFHGPPTSRSLSPRAFVSSTVIFNGFRKRR